MVSRSVEIHAHRGGRSRFPENSIPAVLAAAELGITAVELDLLVSGDRRIVVSHDPWMSARWCRCPSSLLSSVGSRERLVLYSMPYDLIRRCECLSAGASHRAVKPLLCDLVEAVERSACAVPGRPPLIYNLEVKSWPEYDGVYHPPPDEYVRLLLDQPCLAAVRSRVRFQSFDVRILRQLHVQDPFLPLGLLVGPDEDVHRKVVTSGCMPSFVLPHESAVTRELVAGLHRRGSRVIAWTVNDPARMSVLLSLGVDGLITDDPAAALSLLSEAGRAVKGGGKSVH